MIFHFFFSTFIKGKFCCKKKGKIFFQGIGIRYMYMGFIRTMLSIQKKKKGKMFFLCCLVAISFDDLLQYPPTTQNREKALSFLFLCAIFLICFFFILKTENKTKKNVFKFADLNLTQNKNIKFHFVKREKSTYFIFFSCLIKGPFL